MSKRQAEAARPGADRLDPVMTLLKRVFGHDSLRAGQREVLNAALRGDDVLAIMPSGAGKSLCYQLPALMQPGLTIVISPLIALMRDQVRALRAIGVEAAMLTSVNDDAEDALVFGGIRSHTLKLLYMSPERFAKDGAFRLMVNADVRCIAVDEAHCIAHWGANFRPEYQDIGPICAEYAATRPDGRVQIMAVTATADAATRAVIIDKLFPVPPALFVESFDRPNIHLNFARRRAADRQILRFLAQRPAQTGIVYCATRRNTDAMAHLLKKAGHRAYAYHAGQDDETRRRVERVFQEEDAVIIVATIAFGMGVDRPDVRFICHADTPRSVETYYQEIGRAGRDGMPAETLTLYDAQAVAMQRRNLALNERPPDDHGVDVMRQANLERLLFTRFCRRKALLAHFEEPSGACGNCDRCQSGWIGKALSLLRLSS